MKTTQFAVKYDSTNLKKAFKPLRNDHIKNPFEALMGGGQIGCCRTGVIFHGAVIYKDNLLLSMGTLEPHITR